MYDIQKKATKTIKEKLFDVINDQEKETMKKVAFGEGVDIEDLLPLMGIVFRDTIFEKNNLNINQS